MGESLTACAGAGLAQTKHTHWSRPLGRHEKRLCSYAKLTDPGRVILSPDSVARRCKEQKADSGCECNHKTGRDTIFLYSRRKDRLV